MSITAFCVIQHNSTQKHFPTPCPINKKIRNKQQVVTAIGKPWAKYKQILVGLEPQEKKLEGKRNL